MDRQGKGEKATKENMPRRRSLFWDVDPATVDPDKHAKYVIERILDFGRDEEVRWMWRYYSAALIRETVSTSRGISPQSRALWLLMTEETTTT